MAKSKSTGKSKPKASVMQQAMDDALESVERIERERAKDGEGEGEGDQSEQPPVEVDADEVTEIPAAAGDSVTDIDAVKEQLLRLAADFENFRKRAKRDQDELRKYAVEQAIRDMLPVLDNLERALKHANADDVLAQGVGMVAKQFLDVLAGHGVQCLESLGKRFDPEKHEAMGQIPSGDMEPGMVLEEMEKGYTLHDRLLRPAKVLVSAAVADEVDE